MIFCMCILSTINYAMNLVLLLKYSRKSHLLHMSLINTSDFVAI